MIRHLKKTHILHFWTSHLIHICPKSSQNCPSEAVRSKLTSKDPSMGALTFPPLWIVFTLQANKGEKSLSFGPGAAGRRTVGPTKSSSETERQDFDPGQECWVTAREFFSSLKIFLRSWVLAALSTSRSLVVGRSIGLLETLWKSDLKSIKW